MQAVEPAVLTVPDVARILKVGRTFAYEMVATGKIPGVIRLGPQVVRIDKAVFERWLSEQATP